MTESAEGFDFVPANEDPEAAAAAARLTQEDTAQPPAIPVPLDGPVTLVAGFRRPKGDGGEFETVRKAWVRELNGFDEERIARAKQRDDISEFVNEILVCGVEKLGDHPPTKEDLDSLVMGDRSYLLLEISRATYGDEIEYDDFLCPHCGETLSFVVHKGTDVPTPRLDSVDDVEFEVRLKKDRVAVVTLPTGEISYAMAETKTEADANTVLVSHCVQEIRGPRGVTEIAGDMDAARKLSIPDRLTLVEEMNKRMPGPKYDEVRFEHPECGKEIRLSISLADLFLGL